MTFAPPEAYARLADYLLGKAPESEQADIEERLFTEDGFHAELTAAMDDLCLAYLGGRLEAEDKLRFEQHFLASAPHRERLEFVQDLLAAGEGAPGVPATGVRPRALVLRLLAAGVVLAVGGTVAWRFWLADGDAPHVAAGPGTTAPETPRPSETSSARPQPSVAEAQSTVALVRLPHGAPAAPVRVALAPATASVRLEVPVGATRHPTFEAVLRDRSGAEVWRRQDLEQPGPGEPLSVPVPAEALREGQYTLRVEGEALRGDKAPRLSLSYTLDVRRAPEPAQSP